MCQYNCHFTTPIGVLNIQYDENFLYEIGLIKNKDYESERYVKCDIIHDTKKQLTKYFMGKRCVFDLPIKLIGTEFQLKVWNQLRKIPYGITWSYEEVAKEINMPKAARAVGMANNKNPIIIIIPCHRVIGKNNRLVGYGAGINIKKYLLLHENIKIYNDKVIK